MLKNLKFSTKLILLIGSSSLIVILSLVLSSFFLIKKNISNQIYKELQQITNSTYNLVETTYQVTVQNHMQSVAKTTSEIVNSYYGRALSGEITKQKAIDEIQKIYQTNNDQKSNIIIIDTTGKVILHQDISLIDSNIAHLNFIKAQLRNKEGYFEYNPEKKMEEDGGKVVSFSTYFQPWNMIIIATANRDELEKLVPFDELKKKILSIKLGKTGYAYVSDTNGNLIIHPRQEKKNFYNIKDADGHYFVREICTTKNGQIIYPWKNPDDSKTRDKVANYKYFKHLDWIIASGVYLNELYAPLYKPLNTILFIIVVLIMLIIIMSLSIGKSFSRPLISLAENAEIIGQGNLIHIEYDENRFDEIGILARSLQKMRSNLLNIIINIKEIAGMLQDSSKKLLTLSSGFTGNTRIVSGQTFSVSVSTKQMSQNINTMTTAAEQMNYNISQVASASDEIDQSMKIASESIRELSLSMENIVYNSKKASKIANKATKMAGDASLSINTLGISANEIGEVTEIIKGIAEKTNLLALNATIEAASAGEAGKGFSVVANEIKELAKQSAGAAENIAHKIEDIQTKTGIAIKNIGNVSEIVSEINKTESEIDGLVDKQSDAIESISVNVDETNIGITNVAKSVRQLTNSSSQLSKNATEIAKSVKNVSESITQISDIMKQNSENVENVGNSSNNINRIALRLNNIIEQFKFYK